MIGGRDHFLLPDVFAEHEQDIAAFELVTEIEIAFSARDMKITDGLVEIGDAQSAADGRDDREIVGDGGGPDKTPFAGVDFKRVGEDVDRIKANLFGEFDALCGIDWRTEPGRVDEA